MPVNPSMFSSALVAAPVLPGNTCTRGTREGGGS
jgi:hypothetical protein